MSGSFCELAGLYQIYGKEAVNKLDECHGIVWRDPKGEISQGLPQAPISLDEVPFIYEEYENMMPFENRILYYETSRGCRFRAVIAFLRSISGCGFEAWSW